MMNGTLRQQSEASPAVAILLPIMLDIKETQGQHGAEIRELRDDVRKLKSQRQLYLLPKDYIRLGAALGLFLFVMSHKLGLTNLGPSILGSLRGGALGGLPGLH